MSDRMALKLAFDLMLVPSQVRLFRAQPLPDGIVLLLRIAAGDDGADEIAVELTSRPRKAVQRAATFFIEQILFAPDADSYRVLGANPESSAAELRRNAALLLKWLHPDVDRDGAGSIFAGRVTAAWNDLKTPERRAAYDEHCRRLARRHRTGSWRRRNGVWAAPGLSRRSERDGGVGFFHRALLALLPRLNH